MITIAAWKCSRSGLGHYTRAIKYFKFFKSRDKKVRFLKFKNLLDLYSKIKKKNGSILLIDTYIFSKKIEKLLRKNFKKIIIINDYQFRIPKDFYQLDPFKYSKKIKQKNKYFGTEYSPVIINKNILYNKNKKKIDLLIIMNSNFQNVLIRSNKLISEKHKKKVVVNVKSKKLKNFLESKKNIIVKSFISEEKLLNYAIKSKFIISPGGQTMMNLVEHNQFINVYKTSKNQYFYIKKLNEKNIVNKINLKKYHLKRNKNTRYNQNNKKKKLLNIFAHNEKFKKIL